MISIFQNIRTRIPEGHKAEFSYELNRENLKRMIITAILLLFSESAVILLMQDKIFNTKNAIFTFIIFDAISLLLLITVHRHLKAANKYIVRSLQFAYLLGVLLFGCALAVLPQGEFENTHIYIIVVFAIASFLHIPPLECLVLFLSVYIVFFFSLPFYQPNEDAVAVLRLNVFLMNVFSWILSRMVFRMLIKSFTDKKEILEKNLQLKDMTIRDSMTSLLNHENLYRSLEEEIERAKRIVYPLSIAIIDIDDFKLVNDNFGHLTGDKIIISVAKILVKTCRSTDIIGRYGGEEFIVIMPGSTLKEAAILAERIRVAVETTEFENGIHITISGGIREFQEDSTESLIKYADERLYRAKALGKNRFDL